MMGIGKHENEEKCWGEEEWGDEDLGRRVIGLS
jgi:hypothetical protein